MARLKESVAMKRSRLISPRTREVPLEVLREIILLYYVHYSEKTCLSAIRILSVCRRWRKVAPDIPFIWQTIHLDPASEASVALFLEIVKRAFSMQGKNSRAIRGYDAASTNEEGKAPDIHLILKNVFLPDKVVPTVSMILAGAWMCPRIYPTYSRPMILIYPWFLCFQ